MALINLYKTKPLTYRSITIALPKLLRFISSNHNFTTSISLQQDAIDNFTSQLLQKSTTKWVNLRLQKNKKLIECCMKDKIKIQFENLTQDKLDDLLKRYLDEFNYEQLNALISQCIKFKLCPSELVLLNVLSVFSQKGDMEIIKNVKNMCKEVNPKILESNYYFKHYLAEAIWINGNIKESLDLFEELYKNNIYIRRKIRNMFRCLLTDVTMNYSEAVLVNILAFSERIYKDFNDIIPMVFVWRICFLSEWFSDQNKAMDLLDKHENLRKAIVPQIPYVVNVSLRKHKTECVYKLLEVLLKYNLKLHVVTILLPLFDYQSKLDLAFF